MRIRRLSSAHVLALAALFVALGGTSYAVVSGGGIPDARGVFHGCVNRRTGVLRVVKSVRACHRPHGAGKHRRPGELAISWSRVGPRGRRGPPGRRGATGRTGATGTTGAPGSAVAYAFVRSDGTIDETRSKNLPAGTIAEGGSGEYCVSPPSDLTIHVVNVTPQSSAASAAVDGPPVASPDWVFALCGAVPRTSRSFIVVTEDPSGNPVSAGFNMTIN